MIFKKIIAVGMILFILSSSPIVTSKLVEDGAVSDNPKEDVFNAFKNNNINTNGVEFTEEMYSYKKDDWNSLAANYNFNGSKLAGFVTCDKKGVSIRDLFDRNRHVIMHEYLHTITRHVICGDGIINYAYEQITECLANRFFKKSSSLSYNAEETCKLLNKFTTQELFNFYINLDYKKIKSLTD